MAFVNTFHFRVTRVDGKAVWRASNDGVNFRDDEYPDFIVPRGTTDIGVRIANLSDTKIKVMFQAVGHERHGLTFTIGPGRANTEIWDVRRQNTVDPLTWSITGEFMDTKAKIHDPTIKITKSGGGLTEEPSPNP